MSCNQENSLTDLKTGESGGESTEQTSFVGANKSSEKPPESQSQEKTEKADDKPLETQTKSSEKPPESQSQEKTEKAGDKPVESPTKRSEKLPESQSQEKTDVQETGKHTPTKVNLVLLGMAGTGKSATGNTILGKKHFISKVSSMAVTTECKMAETEINGTHVRVIDTPDIFDDDIKPSVKNKHVEACRQLSASGPCVYLLVMHISRFTDGERDVLKKLEEAFGSKVKEQTVIVFTRGDDLHHAEMSLDEFLETCEHDLKELIKNCGGRCVLFENSSKGSDQVTKLMEKADSILRQSKTTK